MSKKSLKQKLADGVFFLDGAMGTQLIAHGVGVGICNEMLNIESPQIILDIHRSYFETGSNAVYTNTFGANEISLGRHNLADKAEQINAAAVKIAKQAADSTSSPQAGNNRYVIGDIGPSGELLRPLGMLEPQKLKSIYAKQAKALCDAGVDGFIVETFMALDEAKVAAEAVKSVCDLPLFATLAFDSAGSDFKTMMGVSVEKVIDEFSVLGIDAIGFNCGTLKMEQYLQLTEKFAKLLDKQTPGTGPGAKHIALIAKPNGGKPELIDGKTVYKLSNKDFADWMKKIHKAGAVLLGGCCGTTPGHIEAMIKKFKN